MNIELLLNIESAILGFIASLYFIVGSITMSGKSIKMLAGTYWDYNEHIAKALSSQRAQYISGALALCLAFIFQFCSVTLPQTILESNHLSYKNSVYSLLLVLLITLLLALRFQSFVKKSTDKSVLLEREKEEEEEEEYQRQKAIQQSKNNNE